MVRKSQVALMPRVASADTMAWLYQKSRVPSLSMAGSVRGWGGGVWVGLGKWVSEWVGGVVVDWRRWG